MCANMPSLFGFSLITISEVNYSFLAVLFFCLCYKSFDFPQKFENLFLQLIRRCGSGAVCLVATTIYHYFSKYSSARMIDLHQVLSRLHVVLQSIDVPSLRFHSEDMDENVVVVEGEDELEDEEGDEDDDGKTADSATNESTRAFRAVIRVPVVKR